MTHDLIPAQITDRASLTEVAETLSQATKEVRILEADRKDLVQGANDTVKKINAKSDALKAPHEKVIEIAEKALSDWRLLPDVQEGVAQIRHLERQSRQAAKDGDVEGVALIAQRVEDLEAKFPKTVAVEGGSLIFGERLEVIVDDFEAVPEEFKKTVIDLEAVEEFIKTTGGDVAGITHGWRYNVSLREKKD